MGQQSGSEFAADMKLLVLLLCLSACFSKVKANDPLGVINAILDTVGISYVPPPERPGTCRDCSRSSLARFGVDLTPTLPTNPCCTTTTTPTTSGLQRQLQQQQLQMVQQLQQQQLQLRQQQQQPQLLASVAWKELHVLLVVNNQ